MTSSPDPPDSGRLLRAGLLRAGLLRAGLRGAGVLLALVGVVLLGVRWSQHPPPTGPGGRQALGPVASLPAGRLVAAPPLADVLQDQGNPVPLADGGTLWLFADTAHLTRPGFFHTSSAAVSPAGAPDRLRYLTDSSGLPLEFLARTPAELAEQDDSGYLPVWPTGGTRLPDGRILVSYAKYYVTRKPVTFTFRAAGLYAYPDPGSSGSASATGPATRIADDLWTSGDGEVGSPVYADGFVYLTVCERLECYPLRVTPDRLTDRSGYTWWTGSGWSPERRDRRPMTFGAGRPGHDPAIIRLPSGVFAMTDTSAGAASGQGLVWVSRTPHGPWSVPLAFTLPGCVSFGCYAVIAHPQQSSADRLQVGYASFGSGTYIHLVDVPLRVVDTGGVPSVRPR
jgi:hypothetical protein